MKQKSDSKKKLPFIEGFITQTLSQNFTAISGDAVRAEVKNLSFENFQAEAEKLKSGRLLNVYTESNRAEMSVLLPDAAQLIEIAYFYVISCTVVFLFKKKAKSGKNAKENKN